MPANSKHKPTTESLHSTVTHKDAERRRARGPKSKRNRKSSANEKQIERGREKESAKTVFYAKHVHAFDWYDVNLQLEEIMIFETEKFDCVVYAKRAPLVECSNEFCISLAFSSLLSPSLSLSLVSCTCRIHAAMTMTMDGKSCTIPLEY